MYIHPDVQFSQFLDLRVLAQVDPNISDSLLKVVSLLIKLPQKGHVITGPIGFLKMLTHISGVGLLDIRYVK